ncbi:MAG: hypothetical protein ABR567_00125 [Myxococcales bacterium]|nr:hypothetical protein [Myxococcales bacterium]
MTLFRKKSTIRRVLGSDVLTGYFVRRAALALVIALGVINLPDMIRYVKIELM